MLEELLCHITNCHRKVVHLEQVFAEAVGEDVAKTTTAHQRFSFHSMVHEVVVLHGLFKITTTWRLLFALVSFIAIVRFLLQQTKEKKFEYTYMDVVTF